MVYTVKETLTLPEKFSLMQQDAAEDVADEEAPCDESELSEVTANRVVTENRANSAPPKVPKIFLSNNCRFNCALWRLGELVYREL